MGQRIDVKNLNIYYGDFLAVEDVNINIEPNKVTAFIGPSGCGKSTVLRTLDRMHEIIPGAHVKGEVLLEGRNLYDKDVDPVAVRRDVGMVFQRPNPFPTMSIKENVLAGLKLNNRKLSSSEGDDVAVVQVVPTACLDVAVDGNVAHLNHLACLRAGIGERCEFDELPQSNGQSDVDAVHLVLHGDCFGSPPWPHKNYIY